MAFKIGVILFVLFTNPIKFGRALLHCQKTGHKYNINMFNFNTDCWCADCGEVFIDEVD